MTGFSITMWQEKSNELKTTLDVGEINSEADISKESNYAGERTIAIEDIEAICQDINEEAIEKIQ